MEKSEITLVKFQPNRFRWNEIFNSTRMVEFDLNSFGRKSYWLLRYQTFHFTFMDKVKKTKSQYLIFL